MEGAMKNIKDYIRTIPDFPQPGVQFRDITTIIQDADGLKLAVDTMEDLVKDLDSYIKSAGNVLWQILLRTVAGNYHL